jgi:3D (Asp-Asp-Asp) domain-containing protein
VATGGTGFTAATAPKADGQPHRRLEGDRNQRLHLALLGALAAAALIALAVPITRTRADSNPTTPPATAASEGLLTTLRSQAEIVAALASLRANQDSTDAQTFNTVTSVPLLPESLLSAVAQTITGTTGAPDTGRIVIVPEPRGPVSFTLHQEGLALRESSGEETVAQALAGLGIRLNSRDLVNPAPQSQLVNGMHIYLTRAKSVRLIAGAAESLIYTRADTIGALMAELGIEIQGTDRIFPGLDEPVRRGMSVSFVTFRDGVEFTEDALAYETVVEYDASMLQGQRQVVQAGVDGYVRRQYQVTHLNGQELERVLVDETWVWPTNEILAVGTRVPVTPAPTRAPVVSQPSVSFEGMSCVRSMNVYATWYTAASSGGSGTTATGTAVYKGIVAVDPSVIPLGTRMYIPGYGYGLAADTGGAIKGNIIDLGYGPDDVKDWRSRYLDICILG